MANRINRYKTLYERMIRPDNASVFPRHVFVRAANLHASLYDRVGDRYLPSVITLFRENCFDTTLVHLTERFNGKEVYLIGTMNQSTMLAQRTKKLIEEIKPDQVLVQAHPK